MLYAIAGVALAGLLRNPGVNIGSPYLLGPIAAVVIGGASLAGGLASPMSTFVAAFFLTGLNQMMRSLGLATSLQFLVFGLVIIGGMLISGDRIIKGVETVLRERRRPDSDDIGDIPGGTRRHRWMMRAEQRRSRRSNIKINRPIVAWGGHHAPGRTIGIIAVCVMTVAACGDDDDSVRAMTAHRRTGSQTAGTPAPAATRLPRIRDRRGVAARRVATRRQPSGRVRRGSFGGRSRARREGARPGRAVAPTTVGTSSWPRSPGPTRTSTRRPSTRRWSAGSSQSCDTGSGGELVMGYADGGGDTVNVWRSVSHMEAILQALTYPEIGKIVSTAANFDQDPEVPCERHAVPGPERRRLHRRVSRRGDRPRRSRLRSGGRGRPVPVLLGGLRRTAGPGGRPRSR